ncbi:uncharacterized protein C2845_PM03G26900 [Panicum miliaceum]|uniref:Uncharacterized protein n=1 Tax=Panicum miliaceum TaxID=4540 RepID=A0A3L6T8U5_PANMI|nr:uncharacterized protein C2845_PM03G26900 [Panicum miliaceum]
MGFVVSSAANSVGTLVGNVVSAPFKLLFGTSCDNVCVPWDLPCFIENVCISSLLRLVVVIIVTATVRVCPVQARHRQGVAKNAFKMVWKPCSAGCHALGLLWQKVRDTKRVHRGWRSRRERDVELGEPSSTSRDGTGSSSSSSDDDGGGNRRRGAAAGSRSRGRSLSSSSSLSVRERRKEDPAVPASEEGQLQGGACCEGKPGEWTAAPPLELVRAEQNGGAAVPVVTARAGALLGRAWPYACAPRHIKVEQWRFNVTIRDAPSMTYGSHSTDGSRSSMLW